MNKSKFQYVICEMKYCEITGNKNLNYLCWNHNENLYWSEEINDETIIYDSVEGAAYYLKPDQALAVLLKMTNGLIIATGDFVTYEDLNKKRNK